MVHGVWRDLGKKESYNKRRVAWEYCKIEGAGSKKVNVWILFFKNMFYKLMAQTGIKPMTFTLLAQRSNQLKFLMYI